MAVLLAKAAAAQTAQGFAVERLEPSAPGSGWFAEDELSFGGKLGGGLGLSLGYAHAPLRVSSADGARHLAVVEHQLGLGISAAVSVERFRLFATFSNPLALSGQGGSVDSWSYTAPGVNLEQNPDSLADFHLGLTARLLGEAQDPLRLGFESQLIFPSGPRADYLTDDSYRAIERVLVAGQAGTIQVAGHLGVQVRPLDEPSPGSPRGSELLFGAAAGAPLPSIAPTLVVGPELFGATALRTPFASGTTALEALLTARLTGPLCGDARLRFKLGAGVGLHPEFGAPQWRLAAGIELLGQSR